MSYHKVSDILDIRSTDNVLEITEGKGDKFLRTKSVKCKPNLDDIIRNISGSNVTKIFIHDTGDSSICLDSLNELVENGTMVFLKFDVEDCDEELTRQQLSSIGIKDYWSIENGILFKSRNFN